MEDNIIIENVEFNEELYQKNLKENDFSSKETDGIGDEIDGVGDEIDGNS